VSLYPHTCAGVYRALQVLQRDLDFYESLLDNGSAAQQSRVWRRVSDDFSDVPRVSVVYRPSAGEVGYHDCDVATRYQYDWSILAYSVDSYGRKSDEYLSSLSDIVYYHVRRLMIDWQLDAATMQRLKRYVQRIRSYYARDHIYLEADDEDTLRRVDGM